MTAQEAKLESMNVYQTLLLINAGLEVDVDAKALSGNAARWAVSLPAEAVPAVFIDDPALLVEAAEALIVVKGVP